MTTTRRKFLSTGALAGAAALAAPAVRAQDAPIKWRMQTYAGAALGEHVIKPAIDSFNKIAAGQMEIELYFADQLVPTSELFRAMQSGTIDAVQSDDDSMQSPTEVTVFGGYFPLALRRPSARRGSVVTPWRRRGRSRVRATRRRNLPK